jgi:membrane protein CcdC involved in cytochrome C biogenesis
VPPLLLTVLRIGPVFGGIALIWWRMRETRVPVTAKSILIPPLGMSTGLFMFISPLAWIPWSWAIGALAAGVFVFSWPVVRTSRLEARNGLVYLRRSPWFLVMLLGLLGIRLALHDYIGQLISPLQTAAVFFLLAFGMIVRWRLGMYRNYRAIIGRMSQSASPQPGR